MVHTSLMFFGLFIHLQCHFLCFMSQPDDLTIQEEEILELIDDGDMEYTQTLLTLSGVLNFQMHVILLPHSFLKIKMYICINYIISLLTYNFH